MITGIVIFVLIIVIYVYIIKFWHPSYKKVTYESIKNKVKTGDIILFSSLDNFNQVFMCSYYTHIGVVYRETKDSTPMIIESFNYARMPFYPKEFSSGMALCDLEHRMSTYRGYIFYKELENPISEEINKEFVNFIEFSIENMRYDPSVVSNESKKILFSEGFTTETNCGQFTTLILLKLGLIDMTHFYNTRKHHLIWTANLTNLINNSYKEPVYVYSVYFKIPKN